MIGLATSRHPERAQDGMRNYFLATVFFSTFSTTVHAISSDVLQHLHPHAHPLPHSFDDMCLWQQNIIPTTNIPKIPKPLNVISVSITAKSTKIMPKRPHQFALQQAEILHSFLSSITVSIIKGLI